MNGLSYKSSTESGVYTIPCIDITGTLHKGLNTIHAQIEDVYGAMIGCSPLYVVQVGGNSIQPFHNIEAFCDLCNDLSTGEKHINIEKIVKYTWGIINFYIGFQITTASAALIVDQPELVELGILGASFGISDMIYATHDVWDSAFMPSVTDKSYEEQFKDWPSWFY